jgi:large subunit ribosomal protein L25
MNLGAFPPEWIVMAETVLLKSQPREKFGTSASCKLRSQGLLPAVVYGHKEATLAILLPKDDVEKAVKRGVRIVDLEAGGKTETARFRELQWDHLGMELVHVDMMRVSKDERIVVQVRVDLRGTAPGVTAGGVLDQPMHTMNVECPALEIPEFIRVNIEKLQLGEVVHVKDLVLPAGVIAKNNPDAIVVQVKAQKEEAATATPLEGAVEPEVIKKAPKPEETEE